MKTKNKIFCIGCPKTGTATFHKCFKILGYKSIKIHRYFMRWWQSHDKVSDILEDDYFCDTMGDNEVFSDWPFFYLYKELDRMYPGSKFILTIRKDEQTWINSLKKHLARRRIKIIEEKSLWRKKNHPSYGGYNEHIKKTKKYFKSRPNDFLILCYEHGDGWEKLCSFLGVPIPDMPFPHINKSK